MANTFKFGNGNWASKKEAVLAYNDENSNFKPLPFTFERGSSATVVNKQGLIETVGIDEPRIDFLNNSKGHLLLEPERRNLITNYTGAGFATFNGASITANDSTSPDGTTNATLMTTTGSANQLIQQASITISSGQSYTVSGYFKLKSGTLSDPDNAFKGLDGLSGGEITGSTFNSTLTSEWQRLSFTVTSSTTSGRVQIKCEDAAEILVWGLQVELGAYETSIIPTSGSAVTRSAETAIDGGNTNVINSTEGTLYIEANLIDGYDNNNFLATIFDNSNGANNNIFIQRYLGNIQAKITVGGTPQAEITQSGTTSGNKKIAFTYKSNEFKLFINGSQVGSTDTSGSVFSADTLDKINVGSYYNDTLPFNNAIKDVKLYNTALTDAELIALTS